MPDTDVRTEIVSTQGMAPDQAREAWRGFTSAYQGEMSCRFPRGDFAASLRRLQTGTHQILTWRSTPTGYRRTARHIRADDVDSYLLVMPMAGHITVGDRERSEVLGRDSARIMSMSRPFEVSHGADVHLLVLTMARREVERRVSGAANEVGNLDLGTGLGLIARSLLISALQECDRLSAGQFDLVIDRLVELLCTVVTDGATRCSGRLSEVEAAARRYVREHADEPDLNGESIAAALGWSVRQVQLALQRAGTTPRDLIREERLALAHARLANPAYRTVSITELAHRSGFNSAGRFSTAFRHRFGLTPRELRERGR